MDYKPHLQRIENQYGKLEGFEDCTDFEKCIILLKKNKCTYKQIQHWLGNPHKNLIKEVIKKYIPESLNDDCNKHKLQSKKSTVEKRLIGMIKEQSPDRLYDLDEFGLVKFKIIEGDVYFYIAFDQEVSKFTDWDFRTQLSIVMNVAKILELNII